MKKFLILGLLALLVCGLSAEELRWDDDLVNNFVIGTSISHYAVLFHDARGDDMPGDTEGQDGVIEQFKIWFDVGGDPYLPDLYIYSVIDGSPGEILSGPLAYNRWLDHRWHRFLLDTPVVVPGEFFAVVTNPGYNFAVYYDTTYLDWDICHSHYISYEDWKTIPADFRIRVVWTPTGPAVDDVSWGWIKALSR